MRKAGSILVLGLLLSMAAFAAIYYFGTSSVRALMSQPQPELAWLKKEFKLSDAEFARISQLHEAYLPQCARRCMLIAEVNEKLERSLNQAPPDMTEIRNLLAARAKMRADCEAEMLSHFLEVSRTMPPAQGQRYLQWVERLCFLSGQHMEQSHGSMNHSAQDSEPMAHHHM